ncbi:DgyrCDS5506 [Dimorphilus gyrociliatus]|uniref:DgyrCDS5506 n=1 Tax=Dimorphilus gyrociliatus TaxID=2664684 RepID=A0A7I8VKR7_9ANNE|nr:DgyrCDS5506 [Dimorphilus gyrociliatus]
MYIRKAEMDNFEIWGVEFPNDSTGKSFCAKVLTAIPVSINQQNPAYHCVNVDCKGSFLYLKTKYTEVVFGVGDIKVEGRRLNITTDLEFLDISQASIFTGRSQSQINLQDLTDNSFSTSLTTFLRSPRNDRPFIRIDFQTLITVRGVIVDITANEEWEHLHKFFVAVNLVPQTYLNHILKTCVVNFKAQNHSFTTQSFRCSCDISGRYVLLGISQVGSSSLRIINLANLYIYGKFEREEADMETTIPMALNILSIKKQQTEYKPILNDKVYYSDGISESIAMEDTEELIVTMIKSKVDTICITVFNNASGGGNYGIKCTFKDGEKIRALKYLTSYFLFEQTTCLRLSMLTVDTIILTANYAFRISELDIFLHTIRVNLVKLLPDCNKNTPRVLSLSDKNLKGKHGLAIEGAEIDKDSIFIVSMQSESKSKFCTYVDQFFVVVKSIHHYSCNNPAFGIKIIIWNPKTVIGLLAII